MAETINRGPNVSAGSLTDGRVEILDGPSVIYQSEVVPDVRFSPMAKDGLSPGRVPGFMLSPQFIVVDAIPSATTTTSVAAAQNPTTTVGAAINLVTAVLGTAVNVPVFTPGIPIIPVGTSVATTVSAIDFGFTTGTTAANSTTVAVGDNTLFTVGQWIVIGGAGSAGVTNKALITQVQSAGANGTSLFVSPAAATALNNAPIGQGNFYGNLAPIGGQLGQAVAASASAAEPYQVAGFAKVFDPRQALTRTINVAAASIGSGTSAFTVSGFDIYGNAQTELITASGTTIVNGAKAFKYITGIVLTTAATSGTPANVSFGESDVVGLNMRNNKWEYLDVFYNGGFAVNNTGWTSAVTTKATATTGDVRGTQNLSTMVTGTGVAGGTANGVKRLTINLAVEQNSMLQATPLANSSLYGVTPA